VFKFVGKARGLLNNVNILHDVRLQVLREGATGVQRKEAGEEEAARREWRGYGGIQVRGKDESASSRRDGLRERGGGGVN
jgi:hypothetical protein